MKDYKLYGTELIQNDNTLKDFANCIYNNCSMGEIMESGEERKDFIMELVEESLKDDISRTNIDYEELLYKYRSEIGDLLYEIENNGLEIPEITFFGKNTEQCFNELIYQYIDLHYDELVSEIIQ